jgi:peptide/nickel transport system substrate-binding protein
MKSVIRLLGVAQRASLFVVMLASLAIAGCSHGSPSGHVPDTVRLVELQDPPGFNPLLSDNARLQDLVPLIHGFLLGTNARGDATPDLVEVVPSVANGGVSRDGLTIRYRLRRGVRWQDGASFDARDVVFSFHAAMNPRNDVPDRSGFDDVAAVRALSPYDVEVRLRRPYSPALATFFSDGANDPYAILPAHLLASLPDLNRADYNALPIGLGPYRVVRWERGSRIMLEADPHFRRGAPKIARVEVRIVPDSNTALTLWQSNELDVLPVRGFGGSRAMLDGARAVPFGHEFLSDHYQFNYVMFNVTSGALRDVRVRRAIVRGVDAARIERLVRGDLYRPGDGDRLPGQFAYDASIRQPSYDPVAAGKLLDAAGWRMHGGVRERGGVPLTVDIVGIAGASGTERFNVQLQAALATLGFRANLKNYQYELAFESAQSGGIFAGGKFGLTFYGWQPGEDADHSYLFRCDTRPPNGENYGRVCDPLIDAAAKREIESTDPAVQAAADKAMLREIDAQSDVFFLGFDREALFVRSTLDGFEPSVLGHHFWNLDRWHWK